jgi:hypothetical protein
LWPAIPLTAPPRLAVDPQKKMRGSGVSTPQRSAGVESGESFGV